MRFGLAFILIATTAQAQDLFLTCSGDDPVWHLTLTDSSARFDFQRQSDLELMLTTTPPGRDAPLALTYVGRGDSFVAILEEDMCRYGQGSHSATILTQRGETPLMLLGCCTKQ